MDITEMIEARAASAATPAERVAAAVADPGRWRRWLAAASMHPDLSAFGVLSLSDLMESRPDVDCTALLDSRAVTRHRGRIGPDEVHVDDVAADGRGASRRLYPAAAVGVARELLEPAPVKVDTSLSESVRAFADAVDSVELRSAGDEVASWIVGARYGLTGPDDVPPPAPAGGPADVWASLSASLSLAARDCKAIGLVWPRRAPQAPRAGARPDGRERRKRETGTSAVSPPEAARPPERGEREGAAGSPPPENPYTEATKASIESIRRDLAEAEKRKPRKNMPFASRG